MATPTDSSRSDLAPLRLHGIPIVIHRLYLHHQKRHRDAIPVSSRSRSYPAFDGMTVELISV
jgi:hypothetical protein